MEINIIEMTKEIAFMYVDFIKSYFYAWVTFGLIGIILADIYDHKKKLYAKTIKYTYTKK